MTLRTGFQGCWQKQSYVMDLAELKQLVSRGESDRLEFKKTTGELKAGMQALCAMLNGSGGMVLFGVTD